MSAPRFARTDSLDERLRAVAGQLTRKQTVLARFMAADRVALAFASAEEVGKQTGVDAATVVRFSRLLGYEGYANLREAVRASVPQFLSAMEKIRASDEGDLPMGELVKRVAQADIENIRRASSTNRTEAIAQAVDAIDKSGRTYVIGFGMSAHVAATLARQLMLIGVPVSRPLGDAIAAAADLADVECGDAVVGVSVWRHLRDTTRLLAAGRRGGATTIGISDSWLSPLAGNADVMLVAPTETPELGHSVTAMVTLTQVLATGVASANRDRAMQRLRKIEQLADEDALWAPA